MKKVLWTTFKNQGFDSLFIILSAKIYSAALCVTLLLVVYTVIYQLPKFCFHNAKVIMMLLFSKKKKKKSLLIA